MERILDEGALLSDKEKRERLRLITDKYLGPFGDGQIAF
jgi:hypothetical protein